MLRNVKSGKKLTHSFSAYMPFPDYVLTSAFPKTMRLGHGLVCASATANRGTMAAMSARRLKRYWTSARYRRAYFANLNE
jgi:hypothetical protein